MSYCPVCGAVGGGGHNSFCMYNPVIISERNHDVFCRAMDRQIESAGCALSDDKIAEIVRRSRLAADLAYPTPKAGEP